MLDHLVMTIRNEIGINNSAARRIALAFLAAMREPNDEMIEAGEEEILCRRQAGAGVFAADIYAAMIGAALRTCEMSE